MIEPRTTTGKAHCLSCDQPLPQGGEPHECIRLNRGKYYEPGCSTCDSIREECSGFGPNHIASSRCQSGRYAHCSCDTCF